jgi:hypothetical protein
VLNAIDPFNGVGHSLENGNAIHKAMRSRQHQGRSAPLKRDTIKLPTGPSLWIDHTHAHTVRPGDELLRRKDIWMEMAPPRIRPSNPAVPAEWNKGAADEPPQ